MKNLLTTTMLKIFYLFLFLSMFRLQAATYYISPSGNDSTGTGTISLPWATIGHGISSMTGGDTLLLNNGVYNELNAIEIPKNGSSGNPTIFRAINPLMVTNIGGFTIGAGGSGYVTWDGIVFQDGPSTANYSGLLQFWHNSSGPPLAPGFTITNCWFVGVQDPTTHSIRAVNMDVATNSAACAPNFRLMNCVFTNNSDFSVSIMVTNGLIANCRFDFANSHDAIHCWGDGITISNNIFTNISANPLVGDHTDILQFWGQNSYPMECTNIYFCYNHIINCDAQFFQLERDTEANGPPYLSPMGGLYVFNNIFENVYRHGSIDIPECHFYNNLFFHCRLLPGEPNQMVYFAGSRNPKGESYNSSVVGNIFYDCGNTNNTSESSAGFYDASELGVPSGFSADYNFVCGENFASKNATAWTLTNMVNLHSINGGNPHFRALQIGDYHLDKNSPLVDAGTSQTIFTDDYDHNARPLGSAWDIGPLEYDPSLLVLFNPSVSFVSKMTNLTANPNDGVIMQLTNWPYSTNINGKTGARFTAIAGFIHDGVDVGWGDYVSITNLTGLQNLTNGTISIWARYFQTGGSTNWSASITTQRLLDAGFQGVPWSDGTFFIGRGFSPTTGGNNQTVMRRYTTDALANPTTLLTWPDTASNGDTTNWHFYTMTWSGTNSGSNILGYWDGILTDSNSLGVSFLRMTNDFNWFSLGCWTHNGTPQMTDGDGYPNNGWLNGVMGEVRIYNRNLSASEVYNLYIGQGSALSSNNGGNTPKPPTGLHVVSQLKVGSFIH